MRLLRSLLILGLLAASLKPGLAKTPADALVVAQNIGDIVTIDPATAYEFTSGEYVVNVYDRLVGYDAGDITTLAPGLATEWTVDAQTKTITFTLRTGVTFASGKPLRAADVIGSWKRVVVLNKAPAFLLTQLGWSKDNIEQMVTAEGEKLKG